MAEARTIKFLKRLLLLAFNSDDPTKLRGHELWAVVLAVLSAGKGNKPTLNHAFDAAVAAGVIAPEEYFTTGDGWEGEHHGGLIAEPGWVVVGYNLAEFAAFSEVVGGLCGGGREFFGGYQHAYLVGLFAALRHGAPITRRHAACAISAYLAIQYLLTVPGTGEVIEIGGRATGGVNTYSTVMQSLWRGDKGAKAPKSDAGISCQMMKALTAEELAMLPDFPQGVEDAVAILERAKVVCPAEFEWVSSNRGWAARVGQKRSWFIDKRTGPRALGASSWPDGSDEKGKLIYGRPDGWWVDGTENAQWHLTLGADGLAVHRSPGGAKPAPGEKPPPERPDEPEEPEPQDPPAPAPNYLDEGDALAKALALWGDEHSFRPARVKGREVRRAIHDEKKRLRAIDPGARE